MDNVPDTISVAVRVRPLIQSEKSRGCTNILEVNTKLSQIYISTCDKCFTFNNAFGPTTQHDEFYQQCIAPIIGKLFQGYNCTILAYGQTGSGKTYTMGTTYSLGEEDMGVIPRAVNDVYKFVKDNFSFDFAVKVSFMELYKEVLYDLLNDKDRCESTLEIREDNKGIVVPNLTEIPVGSAADILKLLSKGSSGRATGRTNMNAQSSRSHAIFTISIAMTDKQNPSICKTSKFHLVDLAGSERAGKTGATGETFDEGVNINKGLLALGNVISALGEDKKKETTFVCYRNSYLTRLLKDSLGGNSITIMIACVSPADYNMDETLSTLRYADRARKIKNKPVVNQDPHVAELNKMQKTIDNLRLELAGQGGPSMSPLELENLKQTNKQLQAKVGKLSCQLSNVISRSTLLQEHLLLVQNTNERMRDKFKDVYNITITEMNNHIESCNMEGIKQEFAKLKNLQMHITQIDAEQNNAESEMQTNDILTSRHSQSSCDTTSGELEQQQRHAANQIHMHEELEEVMKQLQHKEHLARKVALGAGITIDMQAKEDDEAKITALETERDQLIVQLQKAKHAKINTVSAEQRKRVQDLELLINSLKKRVQEQSRRLSMKKRDEERIVQLNDEIRVMKQTKVQLIRNMKTEADTYRKERLRREQEMSKLREQDRKRQNQIVRMESLHNRQTNVLKRQMEEASAVNKRLMAAITLRNNVHDQKTNTGKMERLSQWVRNEIDVMINSTHARSTLTSLMDSRALLQTQLDNLDKSANENIFKQLDEDISLRSLQIKDLQNKLMDSDESKSKINWDYIQTMAEAKHAIKLLFETFPEALKDILHKVQEANNNINNAEYEARIIELEQQIGKLKNDLQMYIENAIEIEEVKEAKPSLNSTVTICASPGIAGCPIIAEFNTPVAKPVPKVKTNKIKTVFMTPSLEFDSSTCSDDCDRDDPDWRKTPLGKRCSNKNLQPNRNGRAKRQRNGGCMCKSNCNARCGCIRNASSCSTSCSCRDSCNNRLKENVKLENVKEAHNLESRENIEEKLDNNVTSRNGKGRHFLPFHEES